MKIELDRRAVEENRRRRADGYGEEEAAAYRQGYNDAVVAARGIRRNEAMLTLDPGDPLPFSTEALVEAALVEDRLRDRIKQARVAMDRWKVLTGDPDRDAYRNRMLEKAQQLYKAATNRLREWNGGDR